MENLSRVKKNKKKKKHMKRLSCITQVKIEFLLPFTGSRKVLGKMPELVLINQLLGSHTSRKHLIGI